MEEDYLVHYGVLGMKWGVRKARKTGTSYQAKSLNTKSHERSYKRNRLKAAKAKSVGDINLAKKYEIKANIANKKAQVSSDIDKKAQKIALREFKGAKGVAKYILAGGPVGSRNYIDIKATSSFKTGKALALSLLSVNGAIGSVIYGVATKNAGNRYRFIEDNYYKK